MLIQELYNWSANKTVSVALRYYSETDLIHSCPIIVNGGEKVSEFSLPVSNSVEKMREQLIWLWFNLVNKTTVIDDKPVERPLLTEEECEQMVASLDHWRDLKSDTDLRDAAYDVYKYLGARVLGLVKFYLDHKELDKW